ncbi:MAG: hypothetical protein ACRD4L_04585, partial [Pyrinomonadaceae bacterium]
MTGLILLAGATIFSQSSSSARRQQSSRFTTEFTTETRRALRKAPELTTPRATYASYALYTAFAPCSPCLRGEFRGDNTFLPTQTQSPTLSSFGVEFKSEAGLIAVM